MSHYLYGLPYMGCYLNGLLSNSDEIYFLDTESTQWCLKIEWIAKSVSNCAADGLFQRFVRFIHKSGARSLAAAAASLDGSSAAFTTAPSDILADRTPI